MRFSHQWLQQFLATSHAAPALAEALTGLGFEVEALEDGGARLAQCEVAEVAAVRPHPRADRLRLAQLRSRRGKATVVCGAPNLRAGMKTIWARPGAHLPHSEKPIEVAEIRGTKSPGMLCSEYELGLSEARAEIIALPPETTLQTSAAAALGLDDMIFDVAIMPNRGDAMSVCGLARELAAAGLGRLKASPLAPALYARLRRRPTEFGLQIAPSARAACPHFTLCEIADITMRPSPLLIQRHLRAAGLRPQSAPVDITNYAALSFGHPLHAYDGAKVAGGIKVELMGARAKTAPLWQGLDGRAYRLAAEDCVIADAEKVLGIGGIMGGAESACQPTTSRLLLEAAWFAPAAIARTGQRLQCVSQARQRYERGVDAALTAPVLAWAAQQIQKVCGGRILGPRRAGAPLRRVRGGRFALADSAALAGQKLSARTAARTLKALGFSLRAAKPEVWHVRAPSWRYDISSEPTALAAELTEEVLRFTDMAHAASAPLPRRDSAPQQLPPAWRRAARVRRHLALRGWDELVCWSFVSESQARAFGAKDGGLRLANPVSEELSVMRQSLLPNLALAVRKNLARRMDWLAPVQVFEIGPVFGPTLAAAAPGAERHVKDKSAERQMAAGLCAPSRPRDWQEKAQPDMFFAMKAHVLAVLQELGVPLSSLRLHTKTPAYYQEGRAASLRCGKTDVAWCGVLAERPSRAMGLRGEVGAIEIALDALPEPPPRPPFMRADYPLVRRDFAFACPASLSAAELVAAACAGEEAWIARAHIFDRFALPDSSGQKSLALEIVLAPPTHTLTDAEIQDFCARLVARVQKKTGARLRRDPKSAPA